MTGDQLRRIRRAMGLTQAALAERLGVAANTVARWERDEMKISQPVALLVRLVSKMAENGPSLKRKRHS